MKIKEYIIAFLSGALIFAIAIIKFQKPQTVINNKNKYKVKGNESPVDISNETNIITPPKKKKLLKRIKNVFKRKKKVKK